MKILVVSKVASHPVRMGNQRLIVDQANLLRELGNEVHYLFVYEKAMNQHKKYEETIFSSMKQFWKGNLHVCKIPYLVKLYSNMLSLFRFYFCKGYCKCDDFYHSRIHNIINKLNEEYVFDCCIVNYYYLSKALTKITIPKKILLTHDSYIYRDMKVGAKVNGALTPDEEAKALQRAPYIFSVQDDESILFRFLSPFSKIYTIYSWFNYVPRKASGNRNILYLSGSAQFNLNGISWFISNIFPSIINKFSDVKLLIGGGICQSLNGYEENEHIELLGVINDTDDFYAKGDIFINPTYQGTGLKIKTFEAIANDMITMTHPHSVEGIFQKESAPLFYSDKVEEWCAFLERVWSNVDEVNLIKSQNREYIHNMNSFIRNQYHDFLNDR